MKLKNILLGLACIPFLPIIIFLMLVNELGKDVMENYRYWKNQK